MNRFSFRLLWHKNVSIDSYWDHLSDDERKACFNLDYSCPYKKGSSQTRWAVVGQLNNIYINQYQPLLKAIFAATDKKKKKGFASSFGTPYDIWLVGEKVNEPWKSGRPYILCMGSEKQSHALLRAFQKSPEVSSLNKIYGIQMDKCIGESGKYSSADDASSETLRSDQVSLFDLPIITSSLALAFQHRTEPHRAILGCGVVIHHPSQAARPASFGLIPLHCLFREPVRKDRLLARTRHRLRSRTSKHILRAVRSTNWQISINGPDAKNCKSNTTWDGEALSDKPYFNPLEIGRILATNDNGSREMRINAEQDWALVELSQD